MDLLPIILQGGAHRQAADYLTLTSRQDGSEVFLGEFDMGEEVWRDSGLYSFNKKDWNSFTLDEDGNPELVTLNNNQNIYVKSTLTIDLDSPYHPKFKLTGKIECSGDLLTSLYNETEIKQCMFISLFENCTGLVKAPELPYINLALSCYESMFTGCTSLTSAPELPATTLANGCYEGMFAGCTSLTSAPELPATTLKESCYNGMFTGCTSLTSAPELPATTLLPQCYAFMFVGCTSLTSAPELPATILANGCYFRMFENCSLLNDVKIYANNISASQCLSDWLKNVAATGTFHNLGTATYPSGTSGKPSGWTEVHS